METKDRSLLSLLRDGITESYSKWRAQYEWHYGDPMDLRSIVIYKMCHSKNKRIQKLGWRLWGT